MLKLYAAMSVRIKALILNGNIVEMENQAAMKLPAIRSTWADPVIADEEVPVLGVISLWSSWSHCALVEQIWIRKYPKFAA